MMDARSEMMDQVLEMMVFAALRSDLPLDIPATIRTALDVWRMLRQMGAGHGKCRETVMEEDMDRIIMDATVRGITLGKHMARLDLSTVPDHEPVPREKLSSARCVELDMAERYWGMKVDMDVLPTLSDQLSHAANERERRYLMNAIVCETMAVVFSGRLGDWTPYWTKGVRKDG